MTDNSSGRQSLWARLRERGVVRVALSYLVIAWLVLQIGDVVLDPLGAPPWSMRLLITIAAIGFPIALAMAWYLELTPSGIAIDDLGESATRPNVRGIRQYADIVIIGALVLVVAFLLVRQDIGGPDQMAAPVVAVLPFEELDSSADNHFGDGFADTLIHKLGVLEQLVVLASSSTFEFRDTALPLTEVAAKLGATVVLQGSMRRAGGLLRLDARLLDASSGQQLWTGNYRRPIGEIFQVQDELTNAVSNALSINLTRSQVDRIARPPTNSLEAYDTFLRASREALESRDSERMPEALQYLYDAIELDPDFALAHATLVEALHLTKSYRHWEVKWSDFAEEARAAAMRAQQLDPNLGEAYLAEAFVAMQERDAGIREHSDEHLIALARKALELSPNNSQALKFLSSLLGDPQQALAMLKRAARIDPRSGIIRINIAERFARLGEFDEAEAWLISSAKATDPYFNRAYKMLVEMNLWDANRFDRAARWARAFEAKYPEDWASKLALIRALHALGAWEEVNELLQRTPHWGTGGSDFMNWIYTHQGQWVAYARGDVQEAVELAERNIRENLVSTPDWPDLSVQSPVMVTSLDLLALVDVTRGNAQRALDRYATARLEVDKRTWDNFDNRALRPAVLHAVLYRYSGQPEETNRLLRDLLEQIADVPIAGFQGKGFTEFTIYAFLGESDKAIAALKAAADAGWLMEWWNLDDGAFDANYAAVLADPRFKQLHAGLVSRAAKMRESYRAEPDLPRDLLLEAGLTVP